MSLTFHVDKNCNLIVHVILTYYFSRFKWNLKIFNIYVLILIAYLWTLMHTYELEHQ